MAKLYGHCVFYVCHNEEFPHLIGTSKKVYRTFILYIAIFFIVKFVLVNFAFVNPLNAKFIKWSNTLKQIVGKLPTICLSVFDHFSRLSLKGLISLKSVACLAVINYQFDILNPWILLLR